MVTDAFALKSTATVASPFAKTARQVPRLVHSPSNDTWMESDSMPFWMTSSCMGWEMTLSSTLSG